MDVCQDNEWFNAIHFLAENMLLWIGFMVFNATFNNISVISWMPVLLMEETGVPGENH